MNQSYHKSLATYFASKSLYLDAPTQKKPNTRKLVEQPWQQTKGELWDEVTDTLCNLDFIQAESAAKMTYELVNDFNEVLEVIPDNQKNIEAEKARQGRMTRYTKDLVAYAKGKIKELDVPESITPWSEDRIEEEIERIRKNPNNADKLKDFSYFIGSKAAIFQKYASDFAHHICDQAWHYANDGPVGKSAENMSQQIKKVLLLCDHNSRPIWNPLPFALKIILSPETISGSIVITPDGKQAIQGGNNSCILWDLSLGHVIKKMEVERSKNKVQFYGGYWGYPFIEEHYGINKVLSITPDGKLAFSGNNQKTCLLWDVTSGKVIKTLKGHSAPINAVSITPDGSWAISGSDDKTCILWDLKSGGKPKNLEGHLSKVVSVSITPDGKRALSISDNYQDKPIIWDIEKGEKLQILDSISERIDKIHITANGLTGLCIGYRYLIRFDLMTGEILQTLNNANYNSYFPIAITSDGKRGLSASSNNECALLDLTTGNKLLTLSGHKSYVDAISITPDGRYGVSRSSDHTIIFWDLEKGKTITGNNHQKISSIDISITPDGKLAFCEGNSNGNASCILMDLETQSVLHEIFATPNHQNPPHLSIYHYGVTSIAITPNGQRGISGLSDFMSLDFPNHNDELLNNINVYDLRKGIILQYLSGHIGGIVDVAITEDGRRAISSSEDETCFLWDLVTGERLKTFQGHRFNVKELVHGQGRIVDKICFGPDGNLVIFSTTASGSRIWNLHEGEIVRITPPLGKAVSITPDGKWAISIYNIPVVSSEVDSLIVWNLKTGKESKVIKHYSKSLNSVSISPDGKRAITVSGDGTCFLCDIENGKIISEHISAFGIYSVNYLPKGIFLNHQYDEFGYLYSDKKMLCPGLAIATIKQLWDFELNRFTEPLVYCPLCGHRFEPHLKIIKTVLLILQEAGLTSDQSPCLELPDEAWEHPGLLGECPNCYEKLKFNPFFGSDTNEIQNYYSSLERKQQYQNNFDEAEKAFKEANWSESYNLYLKLVQQGIFDINYMRFNMALCKINSLFTIDPEIINEVNILIKILQDKGASDKAQLISDKLIIKLNTIKQEELLKNNAKAPWWRKIF